MSGLTRVLSDIHFGDRASQVRRLAQIRPLLEGPDALVLNGDTLDTRPGPRPDYTAALKAEVLAFFPQHAPSTTFLTGNHDPDLSDRHALALAGGLVEVTHGDILFDSITPWSLDAPMMKRLLAEALAKVPEPGRKNLPLAERYALWRQVATVIPQRHQSEKNPLKYFIRFATETIWPPLRPLRIIGVWRSEAERAAAFARAHLPQAKFLLLGHTHRPHISRAASGVTVINTGAYCPPFAPRVVDITADHVIVRAVVSRGGEFRVGPTVAQFTLRA